MEDEATLMAADEAGPAKELSSDGFLAAKRDSDRFWGTERTEGMTFLPVSKGSVTHSDATPDRRPDTDP